jgi:hypothetical protein
MQVNVIPVGVGKWEQYTLPLIKSIQKYAPSWHILCVDNGSMYPDMDSVQMVRTEEVVSYPKAINIGIKAGVADWYIPMNNDVLFHQPGEKHLEGLNPRKFYGFEPYYQCEGKTFLAGWCYFISSAILKKIGMFDDNFLPPMWFDDVDYCWRVQKAGVTIETLKDWGIEHFEKPRARERNELRNQHLDNYFHNFKYLKEKHREFLCSRT